MEATNSTEEHSNFSERSPENPVQHCPPTTNPLLFYPLRGRRGNFVSEFAGGLIFAATRLSVRGQLCSYRIDTARIFLVADFNNRLPLKPQEGAAMGTKHEGSPGRGEGRN